MAVNEQRLFLDNYECFYEGIRKLGMVDVTLPSLKAKTVDIVGAGIAGGMDFPSSPMLENMELKIKWRTVQEDLTMMNEARSHLLTFRGSQRNYDAGSGIFRIVPLKVDVRGVPVEMNLGTLAQASSTDSETTLNLDYLQVTADGKQLIEFDRFNYIYKVNGTDYLADDRSAMGI